MIFIGSRVMTEEMSVFRLSELTSCPSTGLATKHTYSDLLPLPRTGHHFFYYLTFVHTLFSPRSDTVHVQLDLTFYVSG